MSVLVTGASAGFGRAICKLLVQKGYQVIGAARRLDKLAELQQELGSSFYPLQMDIAKPEKVDLALASLPEEWQEIELLVNNAGLALGLSPAYEADFNDWSTMIATNISGLVYLSHQILPQMVARKKGHIINLGSIAGTYPYPGGNIYGATKAFIKQFSLNLRADLPGTNVRVTNIEPGLCGDTEFSLVRFKGDEERVENTYKNTEYLRPEDIANAVLWVWEQPQHVNINSIELMPTAQSSAALNVYRQEKDA